jgi:hypothetical protein
MQISVVILNYINLNADFIGYFKLHLITSILDKKYGVILYYLS